jgi:hypothetical protein
VGCSDVALNANVDAVLKEAERRELATTISMQCAKFSLCLGLGSCLECLEHHHFFILGTQQCQPHVATNIIDEQEKVSLSSQCRRRDRPTQISVHECQYPTD